MAHTSEYIKYKIYDAHAHIFPEKIGEKATKAIGDFYGLPMSGSGLSSGLERIAEKYAVSGFLVSSTATTPKQVTPINDFIHTECLAHPSFIGFGTLHPAFENGEAEAERIAQLGLRGVKFHPDFQHFNIDDPAMDGVYRKIASLGLPVLFHTGDRRYDWSHPRRLRNLLCRIPDLKAIAAHFGGYDVWDEVAESLDGADVMFDTSSSLRFIGSDKATALIDRFGTEHFMFGTDYPMWGIESELELFFALPLDEKRRRMILSENFERFFGIH